jgi:hypothetical protein
VNKLFVILGSVAVCLVIIPAWLVMRVLRIDPLERALVPDKKSYWRKASITANSRTLDALKSQWRS